VELNEIEHVLTHSALASDPNELRAAAKAAGPDDAILVKWKGTAESVLTVMRVKGK
jgi:hypothetical protein